MKVKENLLNRALRRAKENSQKGFSLMEMIISITIMTVLLGALIPQTTVYIDKANKISDVMTASSIYNAAVTLLADETRYAIPNDAGKYGYGAAGQRKTYYELTHMGSNTNVRQKVTAKCDGEVEGPYVITPICMTIYFKQNGMADPNLSRANHGTAYLQFQTAGQKEATFFVEELNKMLSNRKLGVRSRKPEIAEMVAHKISELRSYPRNYADKTDAQIMARSASTLTFTGSGRSFTEFKDEINRFVICYRSISPARFEIWSGPSDLKTGSGSDQSVPVYRVWPDPDDVYK